MLELLKPSNAPTSFLIDPFASLIAKLLTAIQKSDESGLEQEVATSAIVSLETLSPSHALIALSNLITSLSLSLKMQQRPSGSILGSL